MTGHGGQPDDLLDGYLTLALQLNRLVPGLAEAGHLDPELRRRVATGPRPGPADLVRRSGRLAAQLDEVALDPIRRDFLAGQLRAIETTARRLTGQPVPFVREIRDCFGVVPRLGAPDDYAAAHDELAALLPGSGPLRPRLAAFRRRQQIPPERLGAAVAALSELLRSRTREQVALSGDEAVSFRIVDGAPWSALHQYRGRYRSRVTVNAQARPRRTQLAHLVAHEAYPGHHTERCRKEAGVVSAGWVEHGVLVANSPQSLIAEAAAELGLAAVLGPAWGRPVAEALAGQGLGFDGELAEGVEGALTRLARVRQDAALLLHDRRARVEEVLDYLCRWLVVDEPRARQLLRFLRHPVWRGYTTTYVEGPDLLARWWARDPGPQRLRRLLDEPLTPAAVRAELAS